MDLAPLKPFFKTPVVIGGLTVLLFAWTTPSCRREGTASTVLFSSGSAGEVLAGAARVPVEVPWPVVVAGYPPPRSTASTSERPIFARALFLRSGSTEMAWVVLETLTVPADLRRAIQEKWGPQSALELWVSATHTHSSLGGYDRGRVGQLVGIGRFREDVEQSLATAAVLAIEEAKKSVSKVTLSVSGADLPSVVARSGSEVDTRATRLSFTKQDGQGLAQVLILAGHPTLVEMRTEVLSSDYPGELAWEREAAQEGVTLVVQGAAGNASVAAGFSTAMAENIARAFGTATPQPLQQLGMARVQVSLPAPDSGRFLPKGLTPLGDRLLGLWAPSTTEVSLLQLGPVRLLAVPAEPVFVVGRALEQASGALRVVGLTNDYIGYVETPELLRAHEGESSRQYFQETLAEDFAAAARLAAEALLNARAE
jgi:hypothetical protein